jgi:hypothetical protein
MKATRAALLLIGLAAFLAVAGGGAAKEPAKTPFLGMVYTGQDSTKLVRLNPLTLGRRPGRSVQLGTRTTAWSYSPDRSQLVLADNSISGTLVLVDPRAMGRVATVDTGGGNALISATFWPDAQHLYVVRTGLTRRADGGFDSQPAAVVDVDPASRRVVGSKSLDGWVYSWAHGDNVLVLLLGAQSGIGPARLAVVGADGSVRSVGLDGVSVGREAVDESKPVAIQHYAQPGLAVAPDGSQAFVATPSGIAAVDLRSLAASYHGIVRGDRRLQKGAPEGSWRTLRWVQPGVLALSGHDDHSTVDADGSIHEHPVLVGVELVSTKDWTAKMLDAAAEYVAIGAEGMLVTPWRWDAARQQYLGNGATIYGLDGAKRAHVLGKRLVYGLVVGQRAFLYWNQGGSYSIVSMKSGKILRTVRHSIPYPLVGSAFDLY